MVVAPSLLNRAADLSAGERALLSRIAERSRERRDKRLPGAALPHPASDRGRDPAAWPGSAGDQCAPDAQSPVRDQRRAGPGMTPEPGTLSPGPDGVLVITVETEYCRLEAGGLKTVNKQN